MLDHNLRLDLLLLVLLALGSALRHGTPIVRVSGPAAVFIEARVRLRLRFAVRSAFGIGVVAVFTGLVVGGGVGDGGGLWRGWGRLGFERGLH